MVRNGERYVTIDAGRPTSEYDENFLLFVMRLLPDFGADDL